MRTTMRLRNQHLVSAMIVVCCMGSYLMAARLSMEQYEYAGGAQSLGFEPEALLRAIEISRKETSSRIMHVRSSSSRVPSTTATTTTTAKTATTKIVRSPQLLHEHCRVDAPTIVIPAVRKGLNNQRMRIVQDILVAALTGANVELPEFLFGRVGCHYQANCYSSYTQTADVPLWHVFDKESTLLRLHEFGICVVKSPPQSPLSAHDTEGLMVHKVLPLKWPMSTSQLSHMVETGSMVLDSRIGRRWHLGGVHNCCTKILPDSIEAADLLRQINYSFESSHIMRNAVERVESVMPHSNTVTHSDDDDDDDNNQYVALHWRNDGDFTGSVHQLNGTAYVVAAARALQDMRTTLGIAVGMPLHVVVLGDMTQQALQAVEDAVNANAVDVAPGGVGDTDHGMTKRRRRTSLLFACHSKISLVPDMNLDNISPSEDARGQIDFEIGVRAPAFIGSPFSSFSVLIAFQRSYTDHINASASASASAIRSSQLPAAATTAMIDLDIASNVGAIFKLQFPYDRIDGMSDNPCADIISVFDQITMEMMGCSREASSSCPELAPAFAFNPALDDPRRLEGFECTSVVVTTLFGTIDTLPGASFHSNGQSCWFAFVNREAADALGIEPRVAYDTLPTHSNWNIVILDNAQLPFGPDPSEYSRNARAIKMLAHRGFRFARVMLYIDNQQVDILKPEQMGSLVDENLVARNAAWVSPHHPLRQSAYSEGQCAAAHDSLDLGEDKDKVLKQMAMYKAKGFPSAPAQHGGPGLIGGRWHLRNLRRPESDTIGCEWFREFKYWGHPNDELSFNYAVWSMFGIGTINDIVPSEPAFVYATSNETFYTKSRQSSPKICTTDIN